MADDAVADAIPEPQAKHPLPVGSGTHEDDLRCVFSHG